MTRSQPKASSLRRLPKQERSKQRVEQIVDAAAEVFMEVGYEAATTHMIAERAETAIGSLYQFFPDKLAIFHLLEMQHIEQGRALRSKLFTPAFAQLPLEQFIEQMLRECVKFFEHPAPRVILMQHFANPAMFQRIEESFTQEFVKLLSSVFILRNPAINPHQSDLLANVCMQCVNALMLIALRSDETYRQELFNQIRDLLVTYLRPHVGDENWKSLN